MEDCLKNVNYNLNSRSVVMTKKNFRIIVAIFSISLIILFADKGFTATESVATSPIRYYIQMQNEDFLRTMVPKERYLLGLVKNVSSELKQRRSEGISATTLGVDKIERPEEVISEAYNEEFNRILSLLDEIKKLEFKAKQKVDLESLQALAALKNQVRAVIEKKGDWRSETELIPQSKANSRSSTSKTTEASAIAEDTGIDAGDLFGELKYNRILDYKVKLTEYKFLQLRLLKTANQAQKRRMLQRDLKQALETYTQSDFALARLQLNDIIINYPNFLLDDVYFYHGEAAYGLNLLDEALTGYRQLIARYPTSKYSANAMVKMIYIYFIYNNIAHIEEMYQKLLPMIHMIDSSAKGTVSYVVAYAHFRAGQYQKAIDALANITSGMLYFYPSLYLAASCYSNMGNDREALMLYDRLAREANPQMDPVLFQIQNNALLKLGLISYNRNMHELAMSYFNRVSESMPNYDLSLLGKAWSAYESGQPIETLENVETLLQSSLASRYMYEARVLAARSKDILGYKEAAVNDLKGIYQEGLRNNQNASGSMENIDEIVDNSNQAVDARDQELYKQIELIRKFLYQSREIAPTLDQSEPALDAYSRSLEAKIKNLDQIEAETKDPKALEGIRRLRSDLIQILQKQMGRSSIRSLTTSHDPLVDRMGMSDYLKYMFRSLLLDDLREKDQTLKDVQEISDLIVRVGSQNDFELAIRLEIRKEEMEDYYNKLNQYEVWLRENFPQQYQVELEQWTNFSGYGISNINFSRIKECEAQIAQISNTVDALDQVFWSKRKKLEMRIQGLLTDVEKIENQMKQEAEKQEQQERERFFKQDYFDRRSTEPVTGSLKESPVSDKGQGQ